MMISSFAFSATTIPFVDFAIGSIYTYNSSQYQIYSSTVIGTQRLRIAQYSYMCNTASLYTQFKVQNVKCVNEDATFMTVTTTDYFANAYVPPVVPTCTSTQELIDGECVEKCPSGQERFNGTCVNSCNQMLGEFRKQDGTCQDCSSYTNFSSRAFCACDSQDTTYTPHALISEPLTTGNYTYTRTNITCDNGLRISIYTDPVNINPNDYNSTLNPDGTISPDTNHTTTPPETNTTTVTNTTNDVVEAVKASTDVQKDIKTEMGKVSTDVKAMNDQLKAQGATFNEVLTQIKANGTENAKSNQLLGDVNTGIEQFKNKFGQWVDATKNDSANQISAINGTTTAVNSASNAITSKLDEVVNAIKDSNGTGQEIDLNTTNAKLDTLHDDNNKTHSLLDKIAGFFENNATVPDVNMTSQEFALTDLLPDASFFETNKLNLNLNTYHGACYLETTTITIANTPFQFPPPALVDMIPFNIISNLAMSALFLYGLRDFLRS